MNNFEKMNRAAKLLLMAVATSAAGCAGSGETKPDGAKAFDSAPPMEVTTQEERGGTIPGGDKNFTGEAAIQMLFGLNGPRNFSGAYVTFQPNARTNWHTHPAGQTLVVTEGTAWVQLEGEERQELEEGGVIWIPPHVRHWHGATPFRPMTHIALQSGVEEEVVDWGDAVSDEDYGAPE